MYIFSQNISNINNWLYSLFVQKQNVMPITFLQALVYNNIFLQKPVSKLFGYINSLLLQSGFGVIDTYTNEFI